MLGTFMTDINLGIYTAKLDLGDCIYATSEQLRIRHHHYHDVRLDDFIATLVDREPQPQAAAAAGADRLESRAVSAAAGRADHDHAADRPARRTARRRHDRHRRHRRLAVRVDRADDHAQPHRVPQPRLLHVDGLRRAGGARRARWRGPMRASWRSSATARFR